MELYHIASFAAFGLIYSLLIPYSWRPWVLLISSVVAIYWLQPTLDIRWLDYSLPTATIGITIVCWFITRHENHNHRMLRDDWITFGLICVVTLSLTVSRYVDLPITITSRPPESWHVGIFLIVLGGLLYYFSEQDFSGFVINTAAIGIILLFVALKTEIFATELSRALRSLSGQDVTLAKGIDIQWLGFSYIAFRLIHTLRDKQNGLLPQLRLHEYITYVIFFPAYAAGPIDRVERFINDYRMKAQIESHTANQVTTGLTRICTGLAKKFIVADSLAYFSLSAELANQAQTSLAGWVMLYSYALRLYFDFSGYSDIAIGIGILFGIQLPENFDKPYLKNNITAFWQSWHMTLSNWLRAYVYSPLSRSLLKRTHRPSNNMIILMCTLTTMLVIGLWHGITVPFAIWGVWHGTGLFVHKVWSDRTRGWYRSLKNQPQLHRLWHIVGAVVTFHFVALGWIWFALPDTRLALRTFALLLGINL